MFFLSEYRYIGKKKVCIDFLYEAVPLNRKTGAIYCMFVIKLACLFW